MRRAARIVAILGAATIAACFSKPDRPHADGDPDARRDGQGTGTGTGTGMIDAPAMCGIATDNFDDGGTACEGWGSANFVAGVGYSEMNGTLDMTMAMGKTASCQTLQPFHVGTGSQIKFAMPSNALTYFKVTFQNPPQTVEFRATKNMIGMYDLRMICPTGLGTAAPLMVPVPPYVRIRADPPNNGFATAHVDAGDGTTWNPFDSCMIAATTVDLVTAEMGATAGSGGAVASFDDFNTHPCPPP